MRADLRASLFVNVVLALVIAYYLHGDYLHDERLFERLSAPGTGKGHRPAAGGTNRRGCGMCDVAPELCADLGEDNIARALAYVGSNQRLRRVLAKMRRGEPFTIGVIGGSVSKGFGIVNDDPRYAPENMHVQFFEDFNRKFPAKTTPYLFGQSGKHQARNSLVNGAVGGSGSDYFSWCFQEHIPDDVDLVFVEQAINDEHLLQRQKSFEYLLRGLLALPSQPAIINVQVFGLSFHDISTGHDMHSGVAQYYDVPTISVRNLWLPEIMSNFSKIHDVFVFTGGADPLNSMEGYDVRHAGHAAHKKTAEIVSAYIDTQLCEMDHKEEGMSAEQLADLDAVYPSQEIMPQLVNQRFVMRKVMPPLHPNCFSTNGIKHPLVPKENKGWREWNWQEKKYLIADEPGSLVTVEFGTAMGFLEIHFQRSSTFKLGSVSCWVDDEKDKAKRVDGYWNRPRNQHDSHSIRDDLKPGKHLLHCELLKETLDPSGGREFRLISVMSM